MILDAPEQTSQGVLLPLGPLQTGIDYTLISISTDEALSPDDLRLADPVPFGCALGTQITLADGARKAVEDLRPGETGVAEGLHVVVDEVDLVRARVEREDHLHGGVQPLPVDLDGRLSREAHLGGLWEAAQRAGGSAAQPVQE